MTNHFCTLVVIGIGLCLLGCSPTQFSKLDAPVAVQALTNGGEPSGEIPQGGGGDPSGGIPQAGGGSRIPKLPSLPICGCAASSGFSAFLATNGANNVGTNNGAHNTGNGNGNGNVGNGNGNNNTGNGNGNYNCGNNNGNNNGGSNNGNSNSSDGNGNNYSTDGNGNGVASAASQCCLCPLTNGSSSPMSLAACQQAEKIGAASPPVCSAD